MRCRPRGTQYNHPVGVLGDVRATVRMSERAFERDGRRIRIGHLFCCSTRWSQETAVPMATATRSQARGSYIQPLGARGSARSIDRLPVNRISMPAWKGSAGTVAGERRRRSAGTWRKDGRGLARFRAPKAIAAANRLSRLVDQLVAGPSVGRLTARRQRCRFYMCG